MQYLVKLKYYAAKNFNLDLNSPIAVSNLNIKNIGISANQLMYSHTFTFHASQRHQIHYGTDQIIAKMLAVKRMNLLKTRTFYGTKVANKFLCRYCILRIALFNHESVIGLGLCKLLSLSD